MSIRIIVLVLYFFSGFSALVYEITWARMLGLIIGTTVASWGTVLAVYMGGMALGAAIGGRIVDRISRPFHLFALCEAGIGLFGVASPALLHLSQRVVVAVLPFFTAAPSAPIVTRVIVAGGLLAIPTMLMGCTLPAVSRTLFSKKRPFSDDLGKIYSANTFGAVAGSLATGFVLLPVLGMSSSLFLAAGINFAVAVAALFFAPRRRDSGPDRVSFIGTVKIPASYVLPAWLFPSVLACSGFCAMAYEILWSRGLVFFLSSTTYAFTTVLSVVLAGLAFGGIIATIIAKKANNFKVNNSVAWIAALQLGIGLFGFASPWVLQHIDQVIHFAESHMVQSWRLWLTIRYLVCFTIIFPPALCMGATFPFAIGVSIKSFPFAGRTVGYLSSLNTIGGIGGALTAAFLLIPVAGIQRSFIIIAVLNGAAGLVALRAGIRCSLRIITAGITATAALLVLSLVFVGRNPMIFYSSVVRRAEIPVSVVSCKEDETASVAVLKTERGSILNIDGFNAAGTYRYEYMHLLAHLPAMLSPAPDTVLVICLGTGTTCGTVSLYPVVKRVDCVEISPAVIASVRAFSDVNYNVTDNPKVHLMCGDGRNHLLTTRRRYDVITLEPMHPYLASATNLYSSDFYRLCRQRLSEHGVMAQWAPMHILSSREYRMLIAAFASVFTHTSLWFLGTEGVLIGTMDSLRIDVTALKLRMASDAVRSDLARISLDSPERLLSCFLMDEQRVKEYVKDVPVISDDKPRIEFSAPHNLIIPVQRMWLDNMNELLKRRVSVLPRLIKVDSSMAAGINRCAEASSMIMKAEILNARQQFLHAVIAADSALMLMPDDTTATMIRQEALGNAVLWCLNNARRLRSQGLLPQAEQAYLQAIAVDSLCAPAHTELTTLYNSLGMIEKELEHAQKAVMSAPNDPGMHTNLAVVYMNLNRPAEAEAELLRAVSSNETYGRAHYFLAMLYRETGRIEQAQAAIKRAQELGYRPPTQ